jgi:hypothetical protein
MKPVRKGDLVLAPDSLRLKAYPLEVSEVINCMLILITDLGNNHLTFSGEEEGYVFCVLFNPVS